MSGAVRGEITLVVAGVPRRSRSHLRDGSDVGDPGRSAAPAALAAAAASPPAVPGLNPSATARQANGTATSTYR